MTEYKTIAEGNNFIVLDQYTPYAQTHATPTSYQSEAALERELIDDLCSQGYEYLPHVKSPADLMANLRTQIERLNEMQFTDAEWDRLCLEYLDKPGEGSVERTRRIQRDHIYDFTFDSGRIRNIYLVDKGDLGRNRVQVISQFEQAGEAYLNRYDVTILVNGLPLVQVELKRRGVSIREAFNQVHRYSKESFNSDSSLFRYLQLFIISNGTDTRYFANTVRRDKNSFDFTMHWADSKNKTLRELKDFTATFLQRATLLQVLLRYAVLDVSDTLLMMRPYQIAATERILWRIRSTAEAKAWSTLEAGGYIWHTTGSGKTLTSFKAAQLATQLECVDKVLFVVDRKDLDYQTIKEYQRFSPDSVNGSDSTEGLRRNIERDDNKIIVTTIQKLNNLMKSSGTLDLYRRRVVFIFDEAHRSQFGEAQRNLKAKFRYYCQFGFTGTPIFSQNALGTETTASVFGRELLLHPERIREVSQYILANFRRKTHRTTSAQGFNAMFAVSSAEAARRYIALSLRREYASENGTDLADILPRMSPLNPQYLTKKQTVLQRISAFVEKFKGVGGDL